MIMHHGLMTAPVVYGPHMADINPDGPVPIYVQIAAVIAEQIESGELAPHTRVPSESTLMQTYGIARGTARHVIEHLRGAGLIYTVPQRGSFVADRP
jgi:DNA-binding GntR family transcriptional regulator